MTGSAETAEQPPLNDLMMAMDVVDTLRHGEALVERELSGSARRKRMIERLREIYAGQGLEVSDRVLEEGVDALEQERFVYKPKSGGFAFTLARLYIRRGVIAKWTGIVSAVLVALVAGYIFLIQQPAQRSDQRLQVELTETIPSDLTRLAAAISEEANDPSVAANASRIAADGLEAAELGNANEARAATAALERTLEELRLSFDVRILQRPGEPSGTIRIPNDNRAARNYYLIVEAVDADGNILSRTITSEETGDTRSVREWGQRVPENVFRSVEADFEDNSIIERDDVGAKARGDMNISWSVEVIDGAILDWER